VIRGRGCRQGARTPSGTSAIRGWHDFYAGYDVAPTGPPLCRGSGGYFVFDVTNLADPKLLASVTGVAGMSRGHTFTPDPTGRTP